MKTFAAQLLLGLAMFTSLATGSRALANNIPMPADADARRAQIEETRRTQTRRLDAMARDCERKFAVTGCLEQVRAERLAIEGKLNREETLLNDAQRQARGREQRERNHEKAAAHAEKMVDLTKAEPPQAKQPKPAPLPGGTASVRRPADPKVPGLTAQERDAHTKAYLRKQADAIAKRAEVAKRLKDAGVKKSSLPKPE